MAITAIHYTDLLIYTSRGILIVAVEFNEQFWHQIRDKHLCLLLYGQFHMRDEKKLFFKTLRTA